MSIYKILEDYRFIEQMIEDGVPEEEFVEAIKAKDGELSEKLENYAMIITNRQAIADGKKAESKRLAESAKSEENAIKRMKEVMQFAMVSAGKTKIKGEKFNFTVQKNPPSLKVLDENLVPREYVEVEEVIKIDKKAILHELKAGVEIAGVEVVQGESIRIR